MSVPKQENQQVKLEENQFVELKLPDSDSKLVVEYRKDYKQMPKQNQNPKLNEDPEKRPNVVSESLVDKMKVDFLIITALTDEFNAVIKRFSPAKKIHNDKYQMCHCEFPTAKKSDHSHGKPYHLLIACQLEMGQIHAAALSTSLCDQYKPAYVLIVGIAGGKTDEKRPIKRGDVIISKTLIDTTRGKIENGTRHPEWETIKPNKLLLGSSQTFLQNHQGWYHNILVSDGKASSEIPQVYHVPIFSGNDVIKDKDIIDGYKETWKDAGGVEMEGAGVATAISSYVKPSPGFLMIRGVSDLANSEKDDKYRQVACDVAAAYTYAFLKSGPVPALNETPSKLTRAV